MSEKPRPTWIDVSQAGDVAVVHVTRSAATADGGFATEVRRALFNLVDERGVRKLVLSFANLEHLSSTFLGTVIAMHKRVRGAPGRMILCEVDPGIYEVFEMTKLDKIFTVLPLEADALQAIDADAVETLCPVHGCGAWGTSVHTILLASSTRLLPWSITCPECGARFDVDGESPVAGAASLVARKVSLGTYDGERVEVYYQSEWSNCPPRGVYVVELVGRLDLFAADILERAWLTVPPPRRVVIDLRKAVELTGPGADMVRELCARGEDDSRTAVLVGKEKPELAAALTGWPAVHDDPAAAVRALGEIPAEAKRPLTVAIRPAGK
jgi:anti-anti-sigma factor